MIRRLMILGLSLCLTIFLGGLAIAASGTIKCGGNLFTQTLFNGEEEVGVVTYSLRNFSDSKTIHIDRVVVYDQNGAIRCDAPSVDQLWGSSTYLPLGPHQSVTASSGAFANCQNGVSPSPLPGNITQVVISWSNGLQGDLSVNQVGTVRNTTTGGRSDFSFRCE